MFTPYYSIRSQTDIDVFLQQLQDGAKAPKEVYIEDMGVDHYAIPIGCFDVSHTVFFVQDSKVSLTAHGRLNVITTGLAVVTVSAADGFVNARGYSLVYAHGGLTVHAEECSKCEIVDGRVRYLGSDKSYGHLFCEESLIYAPDSQYDTMDAHDAGTANTVTRLAMYGKEYVPSKRGVLMYKAVAPNFGTLVPELEPSLIFTPNTTVEAPEDNLIRLAPNPYIAALLERSTNYRIIQMWVNLGDLEGLNGRNDIFLAKRCRVNDLWFYGDPVETPSSNNRH